MKKFIQICLCVGFLAASWAASAETVKNGLPACVSKKYLDAVKDSVSLTELMRTGKCTILKVGASVVVIDRGFLNSTILLNGIELVTPAEAIR